MVTLDAIAGPPIPARSTPEWRRLRYVGPNWFAAVMGTGIVAVAAAGLPLHVPGLRSLALGFWMLAAALLVAVSMVTATHWVRHRDVARSYLADPLLAHFYGAPPMALMTVGAGALVVGRDLIGLQAAVDLDRVLWTLGSAAGLVCLAVVPFLRFVRARTPLADAGGAWLMSVVPPMVSASTGALLLPHLTSGQARRALLAACYAMFALSLAASAPVITLVVRRLVRHGVGPARLVPTLWIVLGPLGQSITAAGLLAAAAGHTVADPSFINPSAAESFAVGYGLCAAAVAAVWFGLALALTVRQARLGLPFALTWWSFTFPVGTCVTGATALASRVAATPFRIAAASLFCFLLTAWSIVAVRTVRGIVDGTLLRPPTVAALETKAPETG